MIIEKGNFMLKKTALIEMHRQAKAQLVDFAGWEMPLHYGSQLDEHRFVRESAGMFDVSHMGVLDIEGEQATDFLRYALANDVAKLKTVGKALYSCLLNEKAGVIDDLIVYRTGDQQYRLVLNASRCEQDTAWLEELAVDYKVQLTSRADLSILAVQGPQALSIIKKILPAFLAETVMPLKPFHCAQADNILVGRTGYTGEDGVEMILPGNKAVEFWQALLQQGVKPCGLGARDTLRLEAGLNLYGQDMDEQTSPLISNLAWTVSWVDETRDFVGREALLLQKKAGLQEHLVGLLMEEPGVLRAHQKVTVDGNGEGEITSGGFSPTLGHAIALVRLPIAASGPAMVERRGRQIPVKLVKPPFVRNGKPIYVIEGE